MSSGYWSSTVWWYEPPENDGDELIEREKTFSSDEEREEFLKELIKEGLIYDIKWVAETIRGGEWPDHIPHVEETPENGFMPIKKKESRWKGIETREEEKSDG
jgi:hypothetical protein